MIGPLRSYQDVYVAACGQQFCNGKLGREHERTCAQCQQEVEGMSESMVNEIDFYVTGSGASVVYADDDNRTIIIGEGKSFMAALKAAEGNLRRMLHQVESHIAAESNPSGAGGG